MPVSSTATVTPAPVAPAPQAPVARDVAAYEAPGVLGSYELLAEVIAASADTPTMDAEPLSRLAARSETWAVTPLMMGSALPTLPPAAVTAAAAAATWPGRAMTREAWRGPAVHAVPEVATVVAPTEARVTSVVPVTAIKRRTVSDIASRPQNHISAVKTTAPKTSAGMDKACHLGLRKAMGHDAISEK